MDSARVTNTTTLTYILPAHNSADIIERSLDELGKRLAGGGAEIIVVENGSNDHTLEMARKLEENWSYDVELRVLTSSKGLGNAFRTGLAASRGERVCFDGDDLPFGFDFLDAALRLDPVTHPVVIASKAHPDSVVERSGWRRVMTFSFLVLRRAILGMRTRDSQGSYVVYGPWARTIGPIMRESGFLFTTELAYIAERSGILTVEVPVRLRPSHGGHDTRVRMTEPLRMGAGLVALRRRHRRTVSGDIFLASRNVL